MTALYLYYPQAIRRFIRLGVSILMITFCSLNLFGAASTEKESFTFLTGLSVDGILLSDQIGLAPVFKSCDPLSLTFTEMPECSYLALSLTTVDPMTGIPISGPSYLDFNIIYPTGDGEISLKCLTDFVECRLFEPYLGQTFQLSISLGGEDCVSVPWLQGYFRVFGASQSLPTNLSLNLPTQVDQFETFFDCEPILLSFTAIGEYDSLYLDIVSIDRNYGTPIYGSNYLDFSTSLVMASGQFIDLNCIDDPIGCNLFSDYLGGVFQVRITLVETICRRQVSEVGYFQVSGAPTTSSIQLKLASGSGEIFEEVTEVENASPLGNGGGSVVFSSDHGELDSVRITIQEVDCITGENVAIPLVDQASYELFSSGLFDEHPRWAFNLNSIEINGVQGYFYDNPEEVNGHCYRLEIIVSNICGAGIDSSFFFFDENLYLTGELIEQNRTPAFTDREYTNRQTPTKAQIIPQPADQQAFIKLDHPYTGLFTLSLFSTNGKMLMHYSEKMTDGKYELTINNLPAGLYYYQLELPDQLPITGKLLRQ